MSQGHRRDNNNVDDNVDVLYEPLPFIYRMGLQSSAADDCNNGQTSSPLPQLPCASLSLNDVLGGVTPTPLSTAPYNVVDHMSLHEDLPGLITPGEAEAIRMCLQPLLFAHTTSPPPHSNNKRNVEDLLETATNARNLQVPSEARSPSMENVPFVGHLDSSFLPPAKRARVTEEPTQSDEGSVDTPTRFRDYQLGQWQDRYDDLFTFKQRFGHCDVPYTWAENQPLAQWVKRMRYQYRLQRRGKTSTMTEERFQALTDLGLCWDYHAAAWNERLNELCAYKARFGHCNVPGNFEDNRQLAIWVKRQRSQYKLYAKGDTTSNMTADRVDRLSQLGFVWNPRGAKQSKR